MLIRNVPAEEITAEKGLSARKYIPVRPKLKWSRWSKDSALFLAAAGVYRLTVYSSAEHTRTKNGWDWMVEGPGSVELTGFSDSKGWACRDAEAAVVKHARKVYGELKKQLGFVK